MHTVHRTHLPRLINVSIVAAILAIVISLAIAAGINNLSQPAINTSIAARANAPATVARLDTATPTWSSDPFAKLVSRPLPEPWLNAQR